MDERARVARFEQLFAAHLDAAYDFARWLARDERNAEDVVQEACLRAFKSLETFHGGNGRAWLL
ncbi:MAG TPA: sigma factor, partial [Burkholderiales bacterium]|nr:sigma factor [Burkholderiales bacterium]